jgi:hypothetical protein
MPRHPSIIHKMAQSSFKAETNAQISGSTPATRTDRRGQLKEEKKRKA